MISYDALSIGNDAEISEMSKMATVIVREHFDPLIGKAQNDYMLQKFQTEDAIREQLRSGYQYFFVREDGRNIGFLAFYPKGNALYLSKFYLYKSERGKDYSRRMLEFIVAHARALHLDGIELNVNKQNSACRAYESLGFKLLRAEKNSLGSGFYMDDYVYRLEV